MCCSIKKAISGEPSCSKPEFLLRKSFFNELNLKEGSKVIAIYSYNCFGDRLDNSETLVIHVGGGI